MTVKSKHGFKIEGLYQVIVIPRPYFNDFTLFRAKWRRANNATGTSNGHSNQHTVNSNSGGGCDNASSTSSDDDEDLSQKPLQMYLHHQQYYKQMKELQKQQQQQKDTASDNDDNVEVN